MKTDVLHTKDAYHERLVPDELPWYNRQMYFDHFARYVFAGKFVKKLRVLDIACGSGYGSVMLARAGALTVVGIDNAQEAINYARSRYPHKSVSYKLGDAEKIPLKDNSVDVVVSFETLEHVTNFQRFIKEMKRVLKNNGTVILSTPNKTLGTESANPFHTKEFTPAEFEELLKKHFSALSMYGQKPIHARYVKLVTQIISKIPPGRFRWLVDTGFKYFFRGSKVMAWSTFKWGFVPTYLIGVAKNKAS